MQVISPQMKWNYKQITNQKKRRQNNRKGGEENVFIFDGEIKQKRKYSWSPSQEEVVVVVEDGGRTRESVGNNTGILRIRRGGG